MAIASQGNAGVIDKAQDSCGNRLILCDKVVEAAKKTINDQDTEIHDLKSEVGKYQEKSALDEQIKQDQQKQLDSPLHNTVYVGLTAVLITVLALSFSGHVK